MWCELALGPPDDFWRLTPSLFQLAVKGAANARMRARQDRMHLAWHIAALPRLKRLPKLDTLMGLKRTAGPSQSPEQMLAVAMQWHRAITNRSPAARRKTRQAQPAKGD